MSISQKTAWVQLIIFALLVIIWAVLFGVNGTVFYWQDDGMKDIFYYTCAGAFAIVFGLNVTLSVAARGRTALNDERDRSIFRTASFWAASVALTLVLISLVLLTIVSTERGSVTVSVYFPFSIALAGAVIVMLTQAIVSVVLYRKGIRHG